MFAAGRVVLLLPWTLLFWTRCMVGQGFLLRLRVPSARVSHGFLPSNVDDYGLRNHKKNNREHPERRSRRSLLACQNRHHPNHTDDPEDLERSAPINKATAVSFLPEETLQRVQNSQRSNPVEQVKLAKDPTQAFVDIYDYARKIRQGELTWDQVEAADLDTRLKWVGLLHRKKRTPGQFMMRLRVPNGIVTSHQLRFYASAVEPYGPTHGVVDLTTRANIQLRGIGLPDAPRLIQELHAVHNQTSFQSAMDNVRNIVGSPLAGLDHDHELVDTRPFCQAVDHLVCWDAQTQTRGNPQWANLPRKFNIAIAGAPVVEGGHDSIHTNVNDLGLQPCRHGRSGQVGFNVVVGGYLSATRVATAVSANLWIPAEVESVVALCHVLLQLFRNEGSRHHRQKARFWWLVQDYGMPAFRERVLQNLHALNPEVARHVDVAQPPVDTTTNKSSVGPPPSLLGVHPQSQPNKVRVGILVPVGRLSVQECRDLADLADAYSHGEVRLTVDQNVLLPNVDRDRVPALLAEPALQSSRRLKAESIGRMEGHTVSCTGAEFCGLALIETKAYAERLARELELRVTMNRPIYIHWTGCPNSCGQAQVADIGLMGAPAKRPISTATKDDNDTTPQTSPKAVPGCKIFVRQTVVNENGSTVRQQLATEPYLPHAVPLDDEHLLPVLVDILKREFGAQERVVPATLS